MQSNLPPLKGTEMNDERESRSWIGNKREVTTVGRITIGFDERTEVYHLFEYWPGPGAYSYVSSGPNPCLTLESALNYAGVIS